MAACLLLAVPGQSIAGGADCVTTTSGNWSNPTIWSCDEAQEIPGKSAFVTIESNHTVLLDINVEVNSITVEPGGDFNVAASLNGRSLLITDLGFDFSNASIELFGDFTIQDSGFSTPGVENRILILGAIDGTHNLTINNLGTTRFTGAIGENTPLASITTGSNGTNRFELGVSSINVNGNEDSVFTGDTIFNASTSITINQTGSGNIEFNGDVSRNSGGPHSLTVNNASSDTIFNGSVVLGELTTNDGPGDDRTVFNSSPIRTEGGGSNTGEMTFNNPVIVNANTTFEQTTSRGSITFNNTLDGGHIITLNSVNEVELSGLGTITPVLQLNTAENVSTRLNGDIIATSTVLFDGPVTQDSNVRFEASRVFFEGGLDANGNDVTLIFTEQSIVIPDSIVLSNANNLTIGEASLGGNRGQLGTFITGDITTSGTQTYNDAVFVTNPSTLSGTDFVFNNTINAGNAPIRGVSSALTINSSANGITQFNRAVGLTRALDILTTNTDGQTEIGADILVSSLQINDSARTNGNSFIVADVAGFAQSLDIGSGSVELITQTNGSRIAGVLAGNEDGRFAKSGNGDLELAGDNTFAGLIDHQGGLLLINGSNPAASSIGVFQGALGGIGNAAGSTLFQAGVLAPGQSPGIFSMGDISLDSDSIVQIEINGLTPGTEHDQLRITGIVDLADATLELSGNYLSSSQGTIVLIENDGTDPIVGTFADLPEGTNTNLRGVLRISYVGGDGNDVVLIDDVGVFIDSFETLE